jgi:hypothetical protein
MNSGLWVRLQMWTGLNLYVTLQILRLETLCSTGIKDTDQAIDAVVNDPIREFAKSIPFRHYL